MRQDLAKCTTESPRRGRNYAKAFKLKFGGKVQIVHDDEWDYLDERGGFHSSARHRHLNHKDFTDRLGALKGNIRANVGRPWNDVYSEFCRVLDRRGLSGHHIWTHLMQEVVIHTYVAADGLVYTKPHRRYRSYSVDGYYVHPLTGILSYRKPARRQRYINYQRWLQNQLPVPGDEQWKYEQIEGLWFRVRKTEHLSPAGYVVSVDIDKRSANKKEIRWIKQQLAARPQNAGVA